MTIIVFALMSLIPGDPALAILSDGEGSYTQRELDNLRHELGTDRPIAVQYVDWIGGVLKGDFGDSLWFNAPVMTELKHRIPRTLELAVLAIVLAVGLSVPLGVLSAIRPDGWLDHASRVFSLVGVSIPNFLAAILLILFLVRTFGWLPPLGYVELWNDPLTNLKQMAFPALALAFYDMAFIARVTRSSMMEIIREDYMRTARAKGLSERVVVMRHGLKNAALPILTMTGWQFGRLFEGAIIIETIFLIPGMGRILIEAVFQFDFPMIQAVIVIIGVGILTINLAVDLLYGWLDPRIRYG
ncbi:MAG: ABC transporter permease [Chloroflexi bacterium]|nr:ABC transporter permease [Chloroflexota bacterium]